MDHFEHLIAEQSVYAYLLVEQQISQLTQFQQAVQNIYSYANSGIQPLTNVNPDDYSITNLPNTIAYLPNNSIFKNILLIRSDDPDFRFVKISDEQNIFERMQEPTMISDNNFINLNAQQREHEAQQRGNQHAQQPLLIPIGTNTLLTNQPNSTDENYDDPKFNNYSSIEQLPNINTLEMSINNILRQSPESQNVANWNADLYNTYSFTQNTIANVLDNRNTHKNNITMKIRIIDFLGRRPKTNANTSEQMLEIKNIIDSYINAL
ncbi:putative gp028-like protein [Esparto virus]|uniref:Putative gp028-like protein n=1 Tax=Esparto virus TaxID=2072209 RepID=A0A2I7G2Y0_9VIRU|nr:putative gp028-like protein [Esparto virus]AUQ44002.1 putative gp028-like protein [Esparto virus]